MATFEMNHGDTETSQGINAETQRRRDAEPSQTHRKLHRILAAMDESLTNHDGCAVGRITFGVALGS